MPFESPRLTQNWCPADTGGGGGGAAPPHSAVLAHMQLFLHMPWVSALASPALEQVYSGQLDSDRAEVEGRPGRTVGWAPGLSGLPCVSIPMA